MKKLFLLALTPILNYPCNAQTIIDIPVVVHVVWYNSYDSLDASLIQTVILDSLNDDFRRRNADTVYTQTVYKPIAADTEIQFHLAETDPFGNPTTGITWKHTDTLGFAWYSDNMKYDSLGGSNAWDDCRYMNIWICGLIGEYSDFSYPWETSVIRGVSFTPDIFLPNPHKLYRLLTHDVAHFLGLKTFYSTNCTDADEIDDTPIQRNLQVPCNNTDSIISDTVCNPPLGVLSCNFLGLTNLSRGKCLNMFTQGQKQRMHEMIEQYYPGFIDSWRCNTGIEETEKNLFTLYPNPATTTLTIQSMVNLPAGRQGSQWPMVKIHNAQGQEVLQTTLNIKHQTLNIEALTPGIYFLTLYNGEQTVSRKFVKQ